MVCQSTLTIFIWFENSIHYQCSSLFVNLKFLFYAHLTKSGKFDFPALFVYKRSCFIYFKLFFGHITYQIATSRIF